MFVILAHAGKHSENQKGVLKDAIREMLEEDGYRQGKDFDAKMAEGIFLVAICNNS